MKKIKSIQQLHAEKMRIRLEQKEIESRIQSNWQQVKERLHPANLAIDAFKSILNKKTTSKGQEAGFWYTLIDMGFAFLAGKFGDKAAEKLGRLFKHKPGGE